MDVIKKLDQLEKERIAMVARLAHLVAKKRGDIDKASKKHLKGRVLDAHEILTSFVVGGYSGSAGDYDLETRMKPSQVGKKGNALLGVLRKNKAVAAIRTNDCLLNPCFLIVPDEKLEAVLNKFCKSYVIVTKDMLHSYLST